MAYGPMIKRSSNNTRSKTTGRMGDNNDGSKGSKVSAQQCYDQYMAMASESIAMGDRVAAESFYQHAEHYLRLMNEFKAATPTVALQPLEIATQSLGESPASIYS